MAGAQGRLLEEEGFAGMGCSGEHSITGATHVSVSMRERGNLARILGLLSYYPEVPGTQSAQRADRGPPRMS